MKPITLPLPFFGLTIRIETAPAAPKRAAGPHQQAGLLKPTLRQVLGPRVLQDIGLDDSRRDKHPAALRTVRKPAPLRPLGRRPAF